MVEPMLPPTEVLCAAKPTLAAVARAANVSLATASYAVRGDPKIPSATRQRICAVAKQIGYTPNPELGRLMFLLRERHRPQTRATLAVLSLKGCSTAAEERGRALLRGMRERAAALGFTLDPFEVDPRQMGKGRLTQILLSRGVKGVVLAPPTEAVDCSDLLDWERFSAVATSCLTRSPRLARVTPHHFQIAELALRRIRGAGHRRVAWTDRNESAGEESAVSLAAHHLAQRGVDLELVPLIAGAPAKEIMMAADRGNVDAILVPDTRVADEIVAIQRTAHGRRQPIFVLNCMADGRWTGVHQNLATVGRLAIDALARSVQAGECGAATCAAVTMVEGAWVNAAENLPAPAMSLTSACAS